MLVIGVEVTDEGRFCVWYDQHGEAQMVECSAGELAVFLRDLHDTTPRHLAANKKTLAQKLFALLPTAYQEVARDVLPTVGSKLEVAVALRQRGMRGRRRLV